MTTETTFRVQRRSFRNWTIMRDGATRASRIFETKEAAVSFAKGMAKNKTPSTMIVYGRNGSEQYSHSYTTTN